MHEWKPVFLVVEGAASHVAAHPDHQGEVPEPAGAEPMLSRIGTAHRDADGGYIVDLVAIPLSGRVLLRPPTAEDSPTPGAPRSR